MRIGDDVVRRIASLVPRGGNRSLDVGETEVRVFVDGREDVLRFEEPREDVVRRPLLVTPEMLALARLLPDLEKRVLGSPYVLIVPRLVAPIEPVVSGQPTKVRVVLENWGRVPGLIPRDGNAVQVSSVCASCKQSMRVSVAAEPEDPIEIPAGTAREVELVAYFRQPGPNRVWASLETPTGARSQDMEVAVTEPRR